MNLFKNTYDLVRQIPNGKVSTYGNVAKALGDIHAARAVGRMMSQNPNADDMPCYKIVYSDGRLGGFGLGIDDKIRRLKQDNIFIENGQIVDFENVIFDDFKTVFPLKKLRSKQIKMSKKVNINDDFDNIETVAGFDTAYPKNDFNDCCCGCVVMDYKTMEIIEEKTVFAKIFFPYIPTYLSFRELPLVKKLVKILDVKPSIIMLDNINPNKIKKIIKSLKKLNLYNHILLEGSGGINPKNITSYANSGVDVLSLGYLTHSSQALDIKLKIK